MTNEIKQSGGLSEGRQGRTGGELGTGTALPRQLLVLTRLSSGESGARKGEKTWKVHKSRITIGAVESADIRLDREGVSPIHAVIELGGEGGPAALYDLASDTGVTLNGKKVITESLKSGDEIGISGVRFRAVFEDAEKALAQVPLERVRKGAAGRRSVLDAREDLRADLLGAPEAGWDVEEIFDLAPTAKLALECVLSWRSTILDVKHFTEDREVCLGRGLKNDFSIPSYLSGDPYRLAVLSGDKVILRVDSKMSGVLKRSGRIDRIETLRDSGAIPANGELVFGKDDFARINLGADNPRGRVSFYISRTSAPPRLKRRLNLLKDPLFFRIMTASLALSAVTLFSLARITVPENIEAEKLPERLATLLSQPEKFSAKPKTRAEIAQVVREATSKERTVQKPQPTPTAKITLTPSEQVKPSVVPSSFAVNPETQDSKGQPQNSSKQNGAKARSQNVAKEGEGARSKGKEGTRGSSKSKVAGTPQNQATRASPEAGKGRGAGNSQVPGFGNVDLLAGSNTKVVDLFGNSGANLGKGGDQVKGFGGFTTIGKDGLALSGSGSGGGGTAENLAGGLSDKGVGGGRVGTGFGAAGSGKDIVGGKSRVSIRSGGPEEAVVMGSIDASAVEAALLAHRDEFRLCYEREINAENPSMQGRVSTSFVIGSSGAVNQAGVKSTTLKNASVERCILTVIKRIQFPIPKGAGMVEVSYPFKFSPVKGG
jgi:pSer/pThr/pTyr-binding forkhead associated (FHA) protein/outer membrane biosynthesis protein TonB